ncbi:hypothetical protein ACFY8B_10195 [Streptomyces sp. NPDC012751]|uniref:hypothetical protein n=1 Tax=Streptomyces sp. NPDC012751 TaxID=3364846 RepID=UPI0036ACB120
MTAPRPAGPPRPAEPSMRDLLASCAAADAVSRPPRDPEPARPAAEPARVRPRAA